jgi:hypothetical protein
MEEIEASGGREKKKPFAHRGGLWVKEGVYPPVAVESVRRAMKIKEMRGAPLDDEGDEWLASD